MAWWQSLFGQRPAAQPYGLHPDNPVLCGGGVKAEIDYLNRLRCPAGKPVRYQRQGSIKRTRLDYLERPDVALRVSPGTERRLSAMSPDGEHAPPQELPLDVYLMACHCGEHGGQIVIDMYYRGPELPIAVPGWVLAEGVSPAETVCETGSCQHCGQELRTPHAKQCRFCGMDWHDPANVYRREPKPNV